MYTMAWPGPTGGGWRAVPWPLRWQARPSPDTREARITAAILLAGAASTQGTGTTRRDTNDPALRRLLASMPKRPSRPAPLSPRCSAPRG